MRQSVEVTCYLSYRCDIVRRRQKALSASGKCSVSEGGELIDVKGGITELQGLLKQFLGAPPEVQRALFST